MYGVARSHTSHLAHSRLYCTRLPWQNVLTKGANFVLQPVRPVCGSSNASYSLPSLTHSSATPIIITIRFPRILGQKYLSIHLRQCNPLFHLTYALNDRKENRSLIRHFAVSIVVPALEERQGFSGRAA